MERMEEKHRLVREWLESVFAGEEVPEYEITPGTVEELWQLATASREKERRLKTIVEDTEQKAHEYEAESERLERVVEWVGVGMSDLSESATSLCLALSELLERQAAVSVREGEVERERERREEELRHSVVTQATQKQALTEFSQQLSSDTKSVTNQKKSAEFFAKKSNQYQKLISSMKAELQQAGYTDNLSHAALLQTARRYRIWSHNLSLSRHSSPASRDCHLYDLDLAKVKVEGAKRQLVRLEVELSRCLDLVHTEK
ncbi:HAUS augmin-like complex subunit 1 [Geodia barretti]|uniref:HAUS augmin-like complex subunit 1 n=1 Tax=Geodia barretti TaxID=519541 RepID=A0AA35WCA6_GEOBA|nr:HAUS augmin-like complex subunit 1 [Geodia barretti]